MNEEEMILKIIAEFKKDALIGGILSSDNWHSTAERIVKLFAIPDVVVQSEQLICYICKKIS